MTAMTERVSERRYRGLPPEVRQADRLHRFREAGLDAFATSGYMNSSVPEICKLAGLSTRQFYEEFSSREGLILDLYGRIHAEARARVLEAVDGASDRSYRGLATVAVAAYIHSIGDDPRRARLVLAEVVGLNPKVEKARELCAADWSALIENVARASVPEGHEPIGGYRLMMVGLIGAINALAKDWSERSPRQPMSELIDVIIPLMLAMMGMPHSE